MPDSIDTVCQINLLFIKCPFYLSPLLLSKIMLKDLLFSRNHTDTSVQTHTHTHTLDLQGQYFHDIPS